ncbi:Predicted nucleic acid binding protein, YitL type [Alteracholeplasma palmae J233]|uniref:Predicted nucleic acid binding protein, YitL type n=1 Tax=Alteracholeplasma palmae (strain ATCC 49389 / J233) TaxID=1318466 RepID=U4KP64_ALTPJ|nr:S1-like domain-containing RNA-binding protein [Alteracholeplasma palmae]CCV64000.1 Predicted nucleic acid binding protein, YitL type [Alteracholeplasma palmae J233]
MSLKVGEINDLIVVRKSDIAFVLKSEEGEEVFLHFNESNNEILEPETKISAFLYLDHKGRVAATLKKPITTILEPAFLEVVDVNPNLGVFLDLGISKDILFSKDDLPYETTQWPQVHDKLYVDLRVKGKMVAKPVLFEVIRDAPMGNLEINQEVSGYVHLLGRVGIFIVTEDKKTILVRNSQIRKKYRLGEFVTVKISYKSPIGYEGTFIANKEVVRYEDAEMILDYLNNNDGTMPYTAQTDAETVLEIFGLSRKAFKRALGHLYKERKIEFKEDTTVLTK